MLEVTKAGAAATHLSTTDSDVTNIVTPGREIECTLLLLLLPLLTLIPLGLNSCLTCGCWCNVFNKFEM